MPRCEAAMSKATSVGSPTPCTSVSVVRCRAALLQSTAVVSNASSDAATVTSTESSIAISASAINTVVTVIRFSVNVPVLSVMITLVAPRVSTADNLVIRALRFAMRHMPRASAMVATIGNPSGIAATDSAMATSMARNASRPARMPPIAIKTPMTITAHAKRSPSASSRFSSGVRCGVASLTCSKIRPNSVRMPVLTTTPRPEPRVMAVPLNAMF